MSAAIDWPAVHAEALDILVRYLRIDTSNPPGNEAPAARFLGSILEDEGIGCEYVEPAPGRELVVARLRGDGSARPLLLANHLDVVPVEADLWDVPPFDGVVRDGRVYGRGAVDMKGCGVMQLMAMLLLHRTDAPLSRDLAFLAVPDEEAAGTWGMRWVCEHRPDLVDCEFALNEGGSGLTDFAGIDAPVFAASVDEKAVAWLRLSTEGPTGHGSLPHEDNAALRLVRALLALAEWERPLRFTPVTREVVARLTDAALLPAEDEARLDGVLRANPATHAMFVDTLNLTMLDGGIKANVIPSRSEAVLDCRLLPGETVEAWIAQVRERIGDPRVRVEPYIDDVAATEPSPWNTELFATIRDVITDTYEDATVVPALATLATDNRFLRRMGIPAYGLIPCLLSVEERAGFHAHNEFLTLENLRIGTELMYEIVRRTCVSAR